jgi:hypothetical protein
MIGAIATVSAALIAGVFTLIATSNSARGNKTPIVAIQPPLQPGETQSQRSSSSGGLIRFLSDITPVAGHGPDNFNIGFTDTVGDRPVIKTIGLESGEEAEYNIPPSAERFQVSIGVSDGSDGNGGGVFTVYGDTTLLMQQALKRGYLATISVAVHGYKVLRLGFVSPTIQGGQNVKGDFGLARFTG